MNPKSNGRSIHEEQKKIHRSHHSFKKKMNKSDMKQQTSASLFAKQKK